MKKIKLFFVRNYQRFIRFLISFSAIGCILVSSFCVGALSSFKPRFSNPSYFSAFLADGTTFTATTEEPNGVTFSFWGVGLPSPVSNPKSIDLEIPFTVSVPEGNSWNGSFQFYPRIYNGSTMLQPFPYFLSVYLVSGNDKSLCFSGCINDGKTCRLFIPSVSSSGSFKFLFHFDFNVDFDFRSVNFLQMVSMGTFEFGTSSDFFLSGVNDFFSKSIKNLSSFLEKIVSSPALTALCLAMPICGFAVILYGRLRHT